MSAQSKTLTDQDKLTEAFDTIREILVARDLESVRSTLAKLESKVTADLEALRKDARDLIADVEKRLDEVRKKTEGRAKELKGELETSRAAKDESLRAEIGSLGQAISVMQLELQQQVEATERTSALLGNMATVFAGARPAAVDPASISDKSVDDAIDHMFSGDDGGHGNDGPKQERR